MPVFWEKAQLFPERNLKALNFKSRLLIIWSDIVLHFKRM